MGSRKKSGIAHGVLAGATAAIVSTLLVGRASASVVTWSGAGGTSWATANDWNIATGPGTADTASFTDTGSVSIPGTVTSVLNANRTIGGLSFTDNASHYHTLDLAGFTLTETGNLTFNVDFGSTTTTAIRDGNLVVNGQFANIYAGCSFSTNAVGTSDLSGLSSFNATVQDLYVGVGTSSTANGNLTLSPNSNINAQIVTVGSGNGGGASASLTLGQSTTILTNTFTIGQNESNGTVSMAAGGSLNLGSAAQPVAMTIGYNTATSATNFTGTLNVAGSAFNAYFSQLTVGQRDIGGNGGGSGGYALGILTGGNSGAIVIGQSGNTSNVYVGSSLTGGSPVNGNVNFSGETTLNANLNTLSVGTSQSGPAIGVLSLAHTNNINALSIIVGQSGSGTDSMTLGQTNTILANTFIIGQNESNATVSMAAGGSLNLGSAAQPVAMTIGYNIATNATNFGGTLNVGGSAFNAYFSQLTVGQRDIGGNGGGGGGYAMGILTGGNTGAIVIGQSGNTSNVYVGSSLTGGSPANGSVNFSGETSLTANLNTLSVGTSHSGPAIGVLSLAQTNNINALSIIVGQSGSGTDSMTLGQTNTILANSFIIGQNESFATVSMAAGGSLNLGSAAQPVAMTIGYNTATNATNFSGTLNVGGSAFNAYFSQLIVGQRDLGGNGGGGGGYIYGSLIGGSSGAVVVGQSGNTANFYVGRSLTGGSPANGNVDLSGQTSLSTNLNALTVATSQSGPVTGVLALAQSNNINATSVTIGGASGGGTGTATLKLGYSNVILANQFVVAQDLSVGSVTIPSGGNLTLGSAASPTNLSIDVGTAQGNNSTFNGSMDLTNATLTAYLGNVLVGTKNALTSSTGTLTISNNPANYISAGTITLGDNQSTGTLNYAGGVFYATSILKGTAGTANFNWAGGTLSVGSFGNSTTSFNLANTGTGNLAPGSSAGAIGSTTIFGNYTQGASASTSIRIAGATGGNGNDQVAVTGAASLAGNLYLSVINGFTPSLGQNFLIQTYASHTGSYAFVGPPSMPQNVAFQLDSTTSATQMTVRTVAPVSQNYIGTGAVGTFGTAANWSPATVPGTINSLAITTGATAQTITVSSPITVHRVVLTGSAAAPLNFEIQQGINFGVANQLVIGSNASLTGGGNVFGNVSVTSGGSISMGAADNLAIAGSLTNAGTYSSSGTFAATSLVNNASFTQAAGSATLGAVSGTGTITNAGVVTAASFSQGSLANSGVVTANGASVVSGAVTGSGTFNVGDASGTPATLTAGSINQAAVTIGGTNAVTLSTSGAPAVSTIGALGVGGGKLDVGNRGVVITTSVNGVAATTADTNALQQVSQLVANGASNGTTGIVSGATVNDGNTVVGFARAADLFGGAGGTFMGVSVPANALLVRATWPGDNNLDGTVNNSDIRQIIQAGHYNDGTGGHVWSDGDYNHDGFVNNSDIRALIQAGHYNDGQTYNGSGNMAMAQAKSLNLVVSNATTAGQHGDGRLSLVYTPATGNLTLDADGVGQTSPQLLGEIDIQSAAGKFVAANSNFNGSFDTNSPTELDGFKLSPQFFVDGFNIGNVLPTNLTITQLTGDLTVLYSLDGVSGQKTGDVYIVGTPEPASLGLLFCATLGLLARRRKAR